EAARDEAVRARRAQHAARLAAVAADTAFDAHLLERHMPAVVGEHHGERRGAALDRLELQDRGRAVHGRARRAHGSTASQAAKTATAARSATTTATSTRG